MKKILTLAFLALLLASCKTAEKPSPILTIEGGQVQGVATDIAGVTAYKGIPYAAPPLGDLRWKAPQPVVPWDGVKVCDRFGHPSFQAVHYPGGYTLEWGYGEEAPFSEDCLSLSLTGSMVAATAKAGVPNPSSTVRNSPRTASSSCPSTTVSASSASSLILSLPPRARTAFPVTTVSWT